MFLYLYILSVVIFYFCVFIFLISIYLKALEMKLEKITYYKLRAKTIVGIILVSLIPIFNVIVGLYILRSKEIDKIITKALEKNKLRKEI